MWPNRCGKASRDMNSARRFIFLEAETKGNIAGVLAMRPQVPLDEIPVSRSTRKTGVIKLSLPDKIIATRSRDDSKPKAIVLDGGRLVAEGPTARILGDRDLRGTDWRSHTA